MSLIITKNFKSIKAQNAADETEKIAQDSAIVALFQPLADAQAELRDGNKKSNAKNVLAAAISAAEKEFKENPFSSRDKRIIDDAKKVLAQFDSAELNNDADLRAALSKMADIAKRLTDAKVSFKAGWTPDGIGEIILDFPNIESARKYNYYKLFNAWDAARSQILPRWAVNIGGYRVPRIEGNRMTISILHFST